MRAEAVANNGSYALWSGAGPPSLPEQRASTTDDLPKRSSLMRVAGVAAASMAAALVTAEALSSIEIRLRSLGSRRCRTRVSTMFLPAWMKEYCTVENDDGDENSRRIRTQLETTGSPESCALCPACRNPGVSERLERPRARAEEISFCSSAEGEQTFRTFNFTGGCCAKTGGTASASSREIENRGSTQAILSEPGTRGEIGGAGCPAFPDFRKIQGWQT